MRHRILRWLLVFLAFVVAVVDAFLFPGLYIPAVVFVLPILTAAYFLPSPRVVAGIAAWTIALQVVAYLLEGNGLTLLPASYLLGLSLMSALSVVLSDRARREAGLRTRLESIVQQLPAGVIIVEAPSGKTVLANQQMEQLRGLSTVPEDTLADFNRYPMLRPDGTAYGIEELPLARSIRSGEQVTDEEVLIPRQDGSRIALAASSAPIRDALGRITAAVLVLTDISERKRAEAERERLLASEQEARTRAEQAVKARDDFISIAAHELKTPITSLRGFAQMTMRQYQKTGSLDGARLAQAMEMTNRQSLRLTSLVDQLLSLSRLEGGKLILYPEDLDLRQLVEGAMETARTLHPTRTFELRGTLRGCVPVDGLRMEQVLTNLLDNAVKFSPKDSPIAVSLARPEPIWAEIAVRDHGDGVPREIREMIFQQYFQAHGERRAGGMGLGLYISREIVAMHGGALYCEGAEGGGTRFVVRLPIPEIAPQGTEVEARVG